MTPQYRKVNVTVLVSVSPDRTKTPLSLTFEDGKTYQIDRVCGRSRCLEGGRNRHTVFHPGSRTADLSV
mgnify:CR=1 FL=1